MIDLTDAATAVLLGGSLATGLLLAATRVPRWSAPTLSRRIAPYLRDIADPRGLTPLHPVAPGARAWRRRRDEVIGRLGDPDATRRDLERAGWSVSVVGFRARQLAAGLVGLLSGGLGAVAVVLLGRPAPATAVLPVVSALCAPMIVRLVLASAVRRRSRRMREDVPLVLEFLALCLAAGESLTDALRRVGDMGAGDLTDHVRTAVLAVRTGSSLAQALTEMARTVDVPSVTRAVDHLIAAIDRGAPLAHVLQSQATDARDDARRGLIEQAGRKEILMLLPLVFLVLPLSVLFAVFPGIVMLRLGL
ncbi:type II secretion system F family protein [Microbacterium oleivorans]|uniref:Type II secretion system F family protein n=1 Tax=Microbacterium oleivorans TaxID=273677 RepID=A0A7D5IZT4_9MICO|nr:type II secretion system F family protein [Microbacterium oleivorans]QLD13096.1 type II secretion system F family protein [Microbacterium oleivorans]